MLSYLPNALLATPNPLQRFIRALTSPDVEIVIRFA